MAEFPISIEDANKEIKTLISEKGLDVITSKMIRKHLEAKFKCDFEEHKSKLDVQIESCIMEMANEEKKVTKAAKKEKKEVIEREEMKKERSPSTASSDSEAEEDGLSKIKINKNDVINSTSSTNANKSSKSAEKRKIGAKNVDAPEDDMATAIKRRRSNAVIPKKKDKQTAKTKEKSTKNKGKGGGGMFTNMCALSPELATLLGRRYSRRSDVVKEMWNYLRANNLQDPKNKQFYYLDEPLKKIFGKGAKRIKAFGMMGKLKCHVKDIRNLDEATRQIAEAEIAEMLAANEGESEEATNESTSGQQLDENDDEDESVDTDVDQQDDESNEPSSEVKVDADESNISYAKSEELDEKQPSTSTSAYQQEEGRVDEQNGGGQQDSSDSSSELETSSDDSGHDF